MRAALAHSAEKVFVPVLLAVCLGGAVMSIQLTWAGHLLTSNTRESVRRSLELVPANARAWERWAAFNPHEAVPSLERAVALNPYLTTARLELGLRAESAGRRQEAERLLLDAFRHDRMFLTRWTLANFYFRSGDQASFWRWARASAEYAHASSFWLFDLCYRVSTDPALVLNKAIPQRAAVLSEYLSYLLSTGRHDAVAETFTRLAAFRRPADLPVLLCAVDRCLTAGHTTRAVALWNQLAASGFIPHSTLHPGQGRSLTNGSFTVKPLALGFDWRPNWNPEAFVLGKRVEFSGKQLDRTEVLWQPLPLAPGASYALHCRYRTSNIASNSGLRWHLLDPRTRRPLAAPSASLSSDFETEQTWRFQVPASAALGHLTLLYDRAPGTTRIQGALELISLQLILGP